MGFTEQERKIYAKILSDGTLRIPTKPEDPRAEKRTVELTDGSKKDYYELVKRGISGVIEKIDFKEMDFGKMINITFVKEDGMDQVCLSMNTASNFATDLMEKLPNADLSKEMELSPWSMTTENGKTRKGVVVYQDGNKISSFFKEFTEGKKPKSINGFPEVSAADAKKYDTDDWKMYFTTIKKFLVKYTEDNTIGKVVPVEAKPEPTEEELSPFEG